MEIELKGYTNETDNPTKTFNNYKIIPEEVDTIE
jgi:hypothetical protein